MWLLSLPDLILTELFPINIAEKNQPMVVRLDSFDGFNCIICMYYLVRQGEQIAKQL